MLQEIHQAFAMYQSPDKMTSGDLSQLPLVEASSIQSIFGIPENEGRAKKILDLYRRCQSTLSLKDANDLNDFRTDVASSLFDYFSALTDSLNIDQFRMPPINTDELVYKMLVGNQIKKEIDARRASRPPEMQDDFFSENQLVVQLFTEYGKRWFEITEVYTRPVFDRDWPDNPTLLEVNEHRTFTLTRDAIELSELKRIEPHSHSYSPPIPHVNDDGKVVTTRKHERIKFDISEEQIAFLFSKESKEGKHVPYDSLKILLFFVYRSMPKDLRDELKRL